MLRVSLRQLQVFDAVARHKSYTRAAEELFITQSTVSIQLKQMSEILGVSLIEQVGKKLYLTAAGEALLGKCQELLVIYNEIEREMDDFQSGPQGTLKISGTITTQFFLPRVFGTFNNLFPEVNINFGVVNRPMLMDRFEKNKDDLYVLGYIPENMEIRVIPFVENPFIVIAPSDHPLATQKNIPLARILEEPFLMREPGSTTLKEIQQFCDTQKISLKQKMVLGGNEAIKQGVIGGMGISILSRFTTTLEIKLGLISELDVESFPLQRQWYIGYPTGKKLSVTAKAFLDFVRDEGRDIAKLCLYPKMLN